VNSINDLGIWEKDALMSWIFDMEERIFNLKTQRTEGLILDISQETRRESYTTATQDAAARRRVILEILAERGGMTAREVAGELHRRGITPTGERNYAAPRLTELRKAGKIIPAGKRICPQTGRNVAVWAVRG
jgi:hypothetical protein